MIINGRSWIFVLLVVVLNKILIFNLLLKIYLQCCKTFHHISAQDSVNILYVCVKNMLSSAYWRHRSNLLKHIHRHIHISTVECSNFQKKTVCNNVCDILIITMLKKIIFINLWINVMLSLLTSFVLVSYKYTKIVKSIYNFKNYLKHKKK